MLSLVTNLVQSLGNQVNKMCNKVQVMGFSPEVGSLHWHGTVPETTLHSRDTPVRHALLATVVSVSASALDDLRKPCNLSVGLICWTSFGKNICPRDGQWCTMLRFESIVEYARHLCAVSYCS